MKTKKITFFSILWFIICLCMSAIMFCLKTGFGAMGAPATMMAADHTVKEVKGWYGNL